MSAESLTISPFLPGLDTHTPLPRCVHCDYIVLGLPGNLCPECGNAIDWKHAYDDTEQRRRGSPVYQVRSWAIIPATIRSVLFMLFRPITFARRLRYDEPILPAVAVAALAYLSIAPEIPIREQRSYFAAIVTCMLCNALGFATICGDRSRVLGWRRRFRLLLLVSLYSTCFVAAWRFTEPPLLEWLHRAKFLWPLDDPQDKLGRLVSDGEFLGRTLIFYWWWGILLAFAFVRGRSVWRAALFAPVVPVAASLAAQIGVWVY